MTSLTSAARLGDGALLDAARIPTPRGSSPAYFPLVDTVGRYTWRPFAAPTRVSARSVPQINQLQIKQTWPGQARPGHPDLHLSKRSESAVSSRRGNVLWTNSSRTLRSLRKLSHNLSRNLGNLRSGSLGPVVRRAAAFRRSPCRRHRTSPSSHRRFPLH